MWLSITKAISSISRDYFDNMLLAGAFPETNFTKVNGWKSFSLFEYSDTYARFMKLVDAKMKASLDPELGIFTRKHSAKFLEQFKSLLAEITEDDIRSFESRFRSFADAVREEAMK